MIYEYECPTHHVFEVQQKISDDPLRFCPHCLEENKETPLKRLISQGSFILQGGGWASSGYSK